MHILQILLQIFRKNSLYDYPSVSSDFFGNCTYHSGLKWGRGRRQGPKLTLCSIRFTILTNNQSALVEHPLKKVSLAYLMRMWFVKCVFSGMGVNIGIDRVAILFQCKEHTFMYFWVPKLLGIFFLFDLFSSKGVYRVTCFPDWWSSADWRMFSPTRLIIAIILVHWDCFCENFTFYNIGNFHVNSWKFFWSQSMNPQSQIRVIQLPFVTNSTSGQQ